MEHWNYSIIPKYLCRITQGAEFYTIREEGTFIVATDSGKREFKTLVGAFLFYLSYNQEASIYDITVPNCITLVETKRFLN